MKGSTPEIFTLGLSAGDQSTLYTPFDGMVLYKIRYFLMEDPPGGVVQERPMDELLALN